MFKFLTQEIRMKVEREYVLRRASVALALYAALLVFGILALAPSFIISASRKDAALTALASAEKSGGTTEKGVLESWGGRIQGYLEHLAPTSREFGPYEYFQKVVSGKTAGVSLTGLSFDSVGGPDTLRVRGIAKDRQALLLFESELRSSGEWESTSFPVGSLAKEENISFELTLMPKK